jgi:regulator of sigma E protease
LLPIPALDGGRLVFVVIEMITGKRPSQKFEAKAHQIGFMFLILMIIAVTFKDVLQLF